MILSEPVILHFADGSTRPIRGRGDRLLTLLASACRNDLTPGQAQTLAWIRESVSAEEPAGGRMIELLRISQQGPVLSQDGPNCDAEGRDEDAVETIASSAK